jgi:hypothetical protein
MPNACRVCQRDDRAVIDAALARGEALRAVSRRTGIAKTTLLRHHRHAHSPQEPTIPMRTQPAPPPPEVLALAGLVAPLQAQLDALQAETRAVRRDLEQQRARVEAMAQRLLLLTAQVRGHEPMVTTVQALLLLLTEDDDAWQAMYSLLRTSGLGTHGTLHRFVAHLVGRPPPA